MNKRRRGTKIHSDMTDFKGFRLNRVEEGGFSKVAWYYLLEGAGSRKLQEKPYCRSLYTSKETLWDLTMSLSSTRASSMNLATERMSRLSLLAASNMPTTSLRNSGVSDVASRFFRFPDLPPAFGETAQPWEVNRVFYAGYTCGYAFLSMWLLQIS